MGSTSEEIKKKVIDTINKHVGAKLDDTIAIKRLEHHFLVELDSVSNKVTALNLLLLLPHHQS